MHSLIITTRPAAAAAAAGLPAAAAAAAGLPAAARLMQIRSIGRLFQLAASGWCGLPWSALGGRDLNKSPVLEHRSATLI